MKPALYLTLVVALLLPGCAFPGCGEDPPEHEVEYGDGDALPVTSLTYGVYQMLKSSSIPAEIGPEISTPYFDKSPRGLKIHGSPVLFLEYDDEADADALAASISSDGSKVGDKVVTEKGTPHFFRMGKVIAVYFGERENTLEALELTLGPQFAGGSIDKQGGDNRSKAKEPKVE